MKVGIKKLPHARTLPLPHYATKGSAGLDLLAAIDEEIALLPGQRLAVPTGIAIELPEGWEAQVRPRSGLALNLKASGSFARKFSKNSPNKKQRAATRSASGSFNSR